VLPEQLAITARRARAVAFSAREHSHAVSAARHCMPGLPFSWMSGRLARVTVLWLVACAPVGARAAAP